METLCVLTILWQIPEEHLQFLYQEQNCLQTSGFQSVALPFNLKFSSKLLKIRNITHTRTSLVLIKNHA